MGTAVESIIASRFPTVDRRESIILAAYACSDSQIPIGGSKFGGSPDVPQGMANLLRGASIVPQLLSFVQNAPRVTRFIGQINFEEVKNYDPLDILPIDGVLVLFLVEMANKDPGVNARYFKKGEKLNRLSLPGNITSSEPCRLTFEKWVTVPAFIAEDLAGNLEDADDESVDDNVDNYEDMLNELDGEYLKRFYPGRNKFELDTPWHQMLGYHRDIQGSGRLPGGNDNWHLLLQVDSDAGVSMSWGDRGQLYLWIREADLRKKDFSAVQLEFVSH